MRRWVCGRGPVPNMSITAPALHHLVQTGGRVAGVRSRAL